LTPCTFVDLDKDEEVPGCSKPSKYLRNLTEPHELEYFIKIYDIYVRNYLQEADRVWTRFKLFFFIDSGIFIVLGVLWSSIIQDKSFKIPIYTYIITLILIFSGFWASYYWYIVANSSKTWRKHDIEYLAEFESHIFRGENGVFKSTVKMNKKFQSGNWIQKILNMDVTEGARLNAIVFLIVWATILFVVLYLYWVHVFQIVWE